MGRRLNEAAITTRAARQKLRDGFHWRAIDADVHLGYRKSRRAGRWLVRWRIPGADYLRETIGVADDVLDADGHHTYDYAQAVAAARAHVQRVRNKPASTEPPPTVRTACERYDDALKKRGTALPGQRLSNHVLSDAQIADIPLSELKSENLKDWRTKLRAKELGESSVRRISNDFRAALYATHTDFRRLLPINLRDEIMNGFAITPGDPSANSDRPNIILTEAEVRRLTAAAKEIDAEDDWDGDLYALVVGLGATGARFSQLAKARVEWFQQALNRVLVPSSRKGRSSKPRPPAPVPLGADVISYLRSMRQGEARA